MAVGGPGSPLNNRIHPTMPRPQQQGKSRQGVSMGEASVLEREAQKRISRAHEAVEDAEINARKRIDHLRDDYAVKYVEEEAKNETALNQQKRKGYENLSRIKKQQQKALADLQRRGDKQIAETQKHYDRRVQDTKSVGEEKLRSTTQQHARQLSFEKNRGDSELAAVSALNRARQEELRREQTNKTQGIYAKASEEYEALKGNYEKESLRTLNDFNRRYNETIQAQRATLNKINQSAAQKLEETRYDTSEKLQAYSDRQSDPFYKMVDLNASLGEDSEAYYLTADIPPHEQDHISVTVRGNTLVLTGRRSNTETLDLGPERQLSTNSFQQYSETFPIYWPIDARGLSREFKGDQLVVRIPKKDPQFVRQNYEAKRPDEVKQVRPHFPTNIAPIEPPPKQLAEIEESEHGEENVITAEPHETEDA